jgi:hypothetical protein
MKLLSSITVLFLSLNLLAGDQVNAPDSVVSGDSLTTLSYAEIYELVYRTALEDGEINPSEKALLVTLRNSLGLSEAPIVEMESGFEFVNAPTWDQSGRWPLVAQNMVYGAAIYGWMIPYVLDVQDYKWYVGSEMMSLGAAYYLTYKYTENMEISHARAQMMRAGSAVGLRYGQGLNALLELDRGDSRAWAWMLMASVPAGIWVGDQFYHRWQPSNGQAWSLTLWSEIGASTMRRLFHFVSEEPQQPEWSYDSWEQYDRDYATWEREHDDWKKRQLLFEMVGYPLGVYVGHHFFGNRQYTFGDALMLMQGWGVGQLYSLMLADILDVDFDSNTRRMLVTGGGISSTLFMDHYIKGRDYTFGQSVLSVLGTGSGMAFGMGLAVVLEVNDFKTAEFFTIAGGIIGFLLSDNILEVKSEKALTAATDRPQVSVLPTFQIVPDKSRGVNLLPAIALDIRF